MSRNLVRLGIWIAAYAVISAQSVNGELVGWWNFDGNVEDQSGMGNDGELVDATYSDNVPDAIGGGQSISFENDEDHVFIENADGTLDSETFTLSMFINDRGQVGALERLTSREGDTFETALNVHPPFGGEGEYAYFSAAGGGWQWSEDVPPIDGWQHVAYVADNDNESLNIYVDGNLVWETEEPWVVFPSGFMHIGNRHNNVEGFDGLMDDVAIWDEVLSAEQIAQIAAGGVASLFGPNIEGDFDNSGALDVADIDLLSMESAAGSNTASFDLTGDGNVDGADVQKWAVELKQTWIGDANLDGEFNSSDFVSVFSAGLFETNSPAKWSTGDWNGDGFFNSSDFVAAFSDGGFELGPRVVAQAVPEPTSGVLIGVCCVCIGLFYRRK